MSEQTGTTTIPTHRYCPDCGRESEPALSFCGQCGRSLTKSRSHRDQDASNDASLDSPNADEVAEESKRDVSPPRAAASSTSEEATTSGPAQTARTPGPVVAWIRRHKVISIISAVCVGLLILGGISNAVEAHKTNTRYVPVPYSGSSGQTPAPQQQSVPSPPTPAQQWNGDPAGSAYMNAPNQPINSGGFNYGSSYGSSSATPAPPTGGFDYGSSPNNY